MAATTRTTKQDNNSERTAHLFCTFARRPCPTMSPKCWISRYGGRDKLFFLSVILDLVLGNSTLGEFAYFWQIRELEWWRWRLKESELIFKRSFRCLRSPRNLRPPLRISERSIFPTFLYSHSVQRKIKASAGSGVESKDEAFYKLR